MTCIEFRWDSYFTLFIWTLFFNTFIFDDYITLTTDHKVKFDGLAFFVVVALHNLHAFQFMFINRVIAQWASFPWPIDRSPIDVLVESQILEDARPAVNMTTFSDPGDNHLGQTLHAYRTLDITRIHHVEDHLNDILPIHAFIRVKQIQKVVVSFPYNKLEGWLDTVIFRRPVVLVSTSSLNSFLYTIGIWILVIVLESESK